MRFPHVRLGQSLTEIALVLPLLTLLVMGSIDLGRIFYNKITIANATRVAAEFATNTNLLRMSGDDKAVASNSVRNRAVSEAASQNVTVSAGDVRLFNSACATATGSGGNLDFTPGQVFCVQVRNQFTPVTPVVASLLGGGAFTLTQEVELRHTCDPLTVKNGNCVYPAP